MAEGPGIASVIGETADSVVLLVCDQYGTFKGGISTLNRKLGQTLEGREVHCLVLEATDNDIEAAKEDGVKLILPTCSQGDARKPCLDWLTYDHPARYPSLPEDVGWIVGHAGVTSRAAAAIKEQRFPQANLGLVIGTIPENTQKYKDEERAMGIGEMEDSIREDAEKADMVFSVGHNIYDHFTNVFRGIPEDKRPTHHLFLPEPSDLFQKATVDYRETKEKVVLSIGGVNKVETLAAKSLAKVAERSQERILWWICDVSEEEYQACIETDILQTSINSGKLIPTLLPHGTQEDICRHMQQAHLVLMPSRAEPFGLVGLEAMAAGVPVLISDQSGLAALIDEVIEDSHHSVLEIEGDDSADVARWASQIKKVLRKSKVEFKRAAELKDRLLKSRYWEKSHQHFLEAFGCAGRITKKTCEEQPSESVGPPMAMQPAGKPVSGLPVYLQLDVVPQQAADGQAGHINIRVSERILELERSLFTVDVIRDPKRNKETQQLLLEHKAFLEKAVKGSFILLLTFLRQTDVDRFYHNHYRVGEGTLSQQLSRILISDDLQDKVKGAQLIVRLQVKREDYVRVRNRLGQGLNRTTSVNNLLALPPPSIKVDHSSLRGLDLAVSREDRSCVDGTEDVPPLNFTVRELQMAMQARREILQGLVRQTQQDKNAQQRVRQLEGQLEVKTNEEQTARQEADTMREKITSLKNDEEKAQKVILNQKLEIHQLQEIEETNKVRMKEIQEQMKTAKESTEAMVGSLRREISRQKKEIEQLQEANKKMAARMEELEGTMETVKGESAGEDSQKKEELEEGESREEESRKKEEPGKEEFEESGKKEELEMEKVKTDDSEKVSQGDMADEQFARGDQVKINVSPDELKKLQDGHGGLKSFMEKVMTGSGTVCFIDSEGDVYVRFDIGRQFINPAALTKVTAPEDKFCVGDLVQIESDMARFKSLQTKEHGEYENEKAETCGKTGRVLNIVSSERIRVKVHGRLWTFKPALLRKMSGPTPGIAGWKSVPICARGKHDWSIGRCLVCVVCGGCTEHGELCPAEQTPDRTPGSVTGCGDGHAGCDDCGTCRSCAEESEKASAVDYDKTTVVKHRLSEPGGEMEVQRKKLQLLLEEMNRKSKDSDRVEQVMRALFEARFSHYKRMERKQLADHLANIGGAEALMEYGSFLSSQSDGIDAELASECLRMLYTVVNNNANASSEFSHAVGRSGLLLMTVQELARLHDMEESDCQRESIRTQVSVLGNCARVPENLDYFRDIRAVDQLKLHVRDEDMPLRVTTLRCMAHIVDPEELYLIQLQVEDTDFFMNIWNATVGEAEHESALGTETWTAIDLVRDLLALARNDSNKHEFVRKGVMETLIQLIKRGNNIEKEYAMSCVQRFAMVDSIRETIASDSRVEEVLRTFLTQGIYGVQTAAKKTLKCLGKEPASS